MVGSRAEAGPGSTPDPGPAEVDAESARAWRLEPRDPGAMDVPAFASLLARAHSSAGFTFSPEQLQTQLDGCTALIVEYARARTRAVDAVGEVRSPAPDEPASVRQANQTKQSLTNLVGVVDSQLEFLRTWRRTLTTVKADYLRAERLTETQWLRLAGG